MHVLETALVANLAPVPEPRTEPTPARRAWFPHGLLARLAAAAVLLLPLALLLARG